MRGLASHVILTLSAFASLATAGGQRADIATAGAHVAPTGPSFPESFARRILGESSMASGSAEGAPPFALSSRDVVSTASRSGIWSAGRGAKWGFLVGALAIDASAVSAGATSPTELVLVGTVGGVVGGSVGAIAGAIVGARQHRGARLAYDSALDVRPGVAGGALAPGRRIRVSSSDPQLTRQPATIFSIAGDTLLIRADGEELPVAVPLASMSRLEISHGPGSRVEKALLDGSLGGLAGAVALGGLGYASERRSCRSGSDVCGLATGLGAIAGGGLGVIIGAAVGASRPTERWEEVPLHLRVGIMRFEHRSAITLGAAF